MTAKMFVPARDLNGRSTDALQANILADLLEGYATVERMLMPAGWRDLDTGLTYRQDVYAYEVAPTDTPRQARRVELVAGRWAGILGLPVVEVEGADGVRYEVMPSEPCAFMSRKLRETLESEAA